MDFVNDLDHARKVWQRLGWPSPKVMLVSGSGLGVDLAGETLGSVDLGEILPFPTRTVVGHDHSVDLLLAREDLPVLYQRGRLHSYQGYDACQTVLMVRLGALLGVRTLIMTNAAGGLQPEQRAGELCLISDHLNLTGLNPLRGEPPAEWGPRFPDMTDAYDPRLRELALRHSREVGVELGEGVYAGLAGPNFETPAEVRMLRAMGADLAGMSTVLEIIAARHMGVRCLGVSLVANPAAGVSDGPLDHQEVLDAAAEAAAGLARLLNALFADPALVGD